MEAILNILIKGEIGQSYNIGGNNELTNLDLVGKICEILNDKSPDGFDHNSLVRFVTDRPGHDFRYAIDSSKLSSQLNWSANTSIMLGLKQTVEWYMRNEAWWKLY